MSKLYILIFKEAIDFTTAMIILLMLAPFLFLIGMIIKINSKGPVLFKQERVGKNGRPFKILKFRTMYNTERVTVGEVLANNPEVTSIGNVLRRYKIDELPQLINIIRGDMAIVGPRPGLVSQLHNLSEIGKIRLMIKPGLTGLAQVNGNIYLSWEQRWEYDKFYVENLSFILDLRIILKTFLIIILGEQSFFKVIGK